MDFLKKNFIFLSQVLDVPVVLSSSGKKIGYVSDISASLKDMYPRISGLIVRKGFINREKFTVAWKHVKTVSEERFIVIESPEVEFMPGIVLHEHEILLQDTFLDNQIVDISGSKLVRVNDLHLLKEELKFWLVHVDVGVKGLIRRLGWSRAVEPVFRWLFGYEMKDNFISWKYVQPIIPEGGTGHLALKTPNTTKLSELHPADLADIVADLGVEERDAVLRSLDTSFASKTFQELPLKIKMQIAENVDNERLLNIVKHMDSDEAVDFVSELQGKKRKFLLSRLPGEKAAMITKLLGHTGKTAGSIMNPDFISVKQNFTAGAVLDKIKTEARKNESIYYIYVLDDIDSLSGIVTLRQLLTEPLERPVSEFMRKKVKKVKVETNTKDVAEVFYKYDFTIVPVVDKQNKMQGIISIKDAFESVFREIRAETEEDV